MEEEKTWEVSAELAFLVVGGFHRKALGFTKNTTEGPDFKRGLFPTLWPVVCAAAAAIPVVL